ncbi:MAG: hypothetical protein ACUVTG_10440 [Candidatus Oleimicrobiaceae bacterium]
MKELEEIQDAYHIGSSRIALRSFSWLSGLDEPIYRQDASVRYKLMTGKTEHAWQCGLEAGRLSDEFSAFNEIKFPINISHQ